MQTIPYSSYIILLRTVVFLVELCEESFAQQSVQWKVLQEGVLVDALALAAVRQVLPCLL